MCGIYPTIAELGGRKGAPFGQRVPDRLVRSSESTNAKLLNLLDYVIQDVCIMVPKESSH